MRILLSLTLFLAIVGGLNAQSDTTINGATFKANGNVGIGINDPKNVLSVGGGSSFRDGTSLDMVFGKPAGKNGIVFNIKEYPGYSRFNMINNPNDTPSKWYLLLSYNSHPGLSISQTGFVGIGTTSPKHKLDVNTGGGNFKTYQYGAEHTVNTSGGWARGFRLRNERDNVTTVFGSLNGEAYISTGFDIEDDPIGYRNQKLTVLRNGSVGIGTKNPRGVFEIYAKNTNSEVFLTAQRGQNQNSHSPRLNFVGHGQTAGYGIQAINTGPHGKKDLIFYAHQAANYLDYYEAVRFTSKGDVGIGTSDTQGFKLGVKGKVAAEEVKVALHTGWSDFVFYDDYKLPSLSEVEDHINEKGHLQNIPSAEEVEKE